MIVDLPDTTDQSACAKALVKIREEGGAVALGRVLTLVIATPLGAEEEAIEAANDASREHPMRVIVVADRHDATASRGSTRRSASAATPAPARSSCCAPTAPPRADEEGLVTGLLLPDAPVVAWWPSEAPDGASELAPRPHRAAPHHRRRDRRPTRRRPCSHLGRTYAPGDTDFAWTRLTLWRAQLAAVLDQPPFETVTAVEVRGSADSPSTALLGALARARARRAGALGVRGTGELARSGIHGGAADPRGRRHRAGAPRARTRRRSRSPGSPTTTCTCPGARLRECLAEELRRLDPDVLYGRVITEGWELLAAPESGA